MTIVISTSASGPASALGHSPARSATGDSGSPRVAPPKAADRKPDRVTPICTADRNRLGLAVSSATVRPRLPRSASCLTWDLAQRHQSHLRGGEHAADEDEQQDQQDVADDRSSSARLDHRHSLAVSWASLRRRRPRVRSSGTSASRAAMSAAGRSPSRRATREAGRAAPLRVRQRCARRFRNRDPQLWVFGSAFGLADGALALLRGRPPSRTRAAAGLAGRHRRAGRAGPAARHRVGRRHGQLAPASTSPLRPG